MKKAGFTLAEAVIILVLLGVIAVIVLPNSFHNYIHKKQQTQIKKAIAVYENVIKSFSSQTRGTSMEALESKKGNDCSGIEKIVSIKKYDDDDGCIILMDNGLWWDFKDLSNTLVSFEREDLTAENANAQDTYKAFNFVTAYENGKLQILNPAYDVEDSAYYKACKKIYNFVDRDTTPRN